MSALAIAPRRALVPAALILWSMFGSQPAMAATAIDADTARQLVETTPADLPLALEKLEAIPPHVCEVLTQHRAGMDVSGLKNLDEALARPLARCQGRLVLDGIETLSEPCAEMLASCRASISLRGLTSLQSVALAKKIAGQSADVVFPRIARLEADIADILGTATALPVLDGLTELESGPLAARLARRGLHAREAARPAAASANAVAEAPGDDDLMLAKVKRISPAAAAGLSSHPCDLSLPSLTRIDLSTARALGAHQGVLDLDRVENIESDALTSLLGNRGTIDLGGLRSLGRPVPPSVLEAISRHEGALGLAGLVELPPELAQAIRTHRGTTSLSSLEELSGEAARNLAGGTGDVWLDGLSTPLPPAVLAALLTHRGPGKIILPSPLAHGPADSQGIRAAIRGNRFLCLGNTLDCGGR